MFCLNSISRYPEFLKIHQGLIPILLQAISGQPHKALPANRMRYAKRSLGRSFAEGVSPQDWKPFLNGTVNDLCRNCSLQMCPNLGLNSLGVYGHQFVPNNS
ncbi:hypothetical protein CEXT_378621 [Caerostris extrusa]|uniref:Uncharacterized protein n=1 Tax=Caerostris extrusa TaxID=172846 RepID=A0AAV4MYD5_CAEEX|nr:hypothetical protein CEXT_378621 [Caerostris extrusa]